MEVCEVISKGIGVASSGVVGADSSMTGRAMFGWVDGSGTGSSGTTMAGMVDDGQLLADDKGR